MLKDISDYAGFTNTYGGDCTTSVQNMANDGHGNASGVGGDLGLVEFPGGKFVYSGSPLNLANVVLRGRSPWHTVLTCTSPIINSANLTHLTVENMSIFNASGVVPIQIGAATDNGGRYRYLRNVEFHLTNASAFAITGSDTPYFDISGCTFDTPNAICFTVAGYTDNWKVTHNEFRAYRAGAKFNGVMQRMTFSDNHFMHPADSTGGGRYDIWVVPSTSAVTNGYGTKFFNNWHGNEGRAGTDYFMVFADDVGGLPDLTHASAGYMEGVTVAGPTAFWPAANIPYIFSTIDVTHMKANNFGLLGTRYLPSGAYAAGSPIFKALSGSLDTTNNRLFQFLDHYTNNGIGAPTPLRANYVGTDPPVPGEFVASDANSHANLINDLILAMQSA